MAGRALSVEKKLAMILAAEQPGVSVKALCAEMEVHRDSFYEWRRRFREHGLEGLVERSRRPAKSPNATPVAIENEIVRLRKELPVENGADTIGWHMRRAGWEAVPSDRTIHRILVRRGMVTPEPQKRPKSAWRRFEFDRPNECWQIDATDWQLRGGDTVTIMDIIDDHSRVITSLRAGNAGPTTALALETVFDAGSRWGLPAMILSDNGACFTGRTAEHTSEFETTLAVAGIKVIHSRPYHPETCGKIERFHGSLKRSLRAAGPARDITELQAQLDAYAQRYNHDRHHAAAGEMTLAERHAATSPATPSADPINLVRPARVTITAAAVGADGTMTIAGRWRTSIGTEHAGRRLTVLRYGNHAAVIDANTVIANLTLDPDRRYIPSGRPRGGPRRRRY
jgi:transposase InsO family protein